MVIHLFTLRLLSRAMEKKTGSYADNRDLFPLCLRGAIVPRQSQKRSSRSDTHPHSATLNISLLRRQIRCLHLSQ
jgi:hypothetical protein